MAKLCKIVIPITTQDAYDPIGLFVLKVVLYQIGRQSFVLYLLIIVTVLKIVLNF